MKKLITTIIAIQMALMTLLASDGYILVSDMATVQSAIQTITKEVETISSDFIQIKHMDALDMEIKSEGKLLYRTDNALKWEYTTPFSYIITSFNGIFSINNEGDIQEYDMESNVVFREINAILVKSVNGELLNDDTFEVKAYEHATDGYKFILIPKDDMMSSVVSRIEIYWKKGEKTVSKVKMIENESNYTEIQFNNKVLNETIDDNIFTDI